MRVNPDNGKVTFIGSAELPGPDVTVLHATTEQPLFHVEHVAGGAETRPINEWRMVHLTDGPNAAMIERFNQSESAYLPQVIEVYIQDVLKIDTYPALEHAAFAPAAFGRRMERHVVRRVIGVGAHAASVSGPSSCHGMRSTHAASASQMRTTSSSGVSA